MEDAFIWAPFLSLSLLIDRPTAIRGAFSKWNQEEQLFSPFFFLWKWQTTHWIILSDSDGKEKILLEDKYWEREFVYKHSFLPVAWKQNESWREKNKKFRLLVHDLLTFRQEEVDPRLTMAIIIENVWNASL